MECGRPQKVAGVERTQLQREAARPPVLFVWGNTEMWGRGAAKMLPPGHRFCQVRQTPRDLVL